MQTSPSQVKQVATDIVHGHIFDQPWLFITFLAITFLASAAGAFLSGYLKKRGETLATKSDLEEIKEQLRENTHLAEEIKADVHSRYDEKQAIRKVLRDRTEQLVMATFELEQWLSQAQARSANGEISLFDESPLSKISTYKDIYFPEILAEYHVLSSTYFDYVKWLIALRSVNLSKNPIAIQQHLDGFRTVYQPFHTSLAPFRARVIAAARDRGGL